MNGWTLLMAAAAAYLAGALAQTGPAGFWLSVVVMGWIGWNAEKWTRRKG